MKIIEKVVLVWDEKQTQMDSGMNPPVVPFTEEMEGLKEGDIILLNSQEELWMFDYKIIKICDFNDRPYRIFFLDKVSTI